MYKYLLVVCCFYFLSCEEQPVFVPDFNTPDPMSMENDSTRAIFIYELTGVSCPNCPAGASRIESIINIFGDRVIPVAIHGEFLSEPISGSSNYDFRNQEGQDLERTLAPFFGKPAANFNLLQLEGQPEFSVSNINLWTSTVEELLSIPKILSLNIQSDFNAADRSYTVEVDLTPLEALSGDLRLNVMLTESHIIDAQLNQTEVIEDYEHNHVFRTMLSDIEGDALPNSIAQNENITRTYTGVLGGDTALNIPENMEVVAFVSLSNGSTREVLEGSNTHLTE